MNGTPALTTHSWSAPSSVRTISFRRAAAIRVIITRKSRFTTCGAPGRGSAADPEMVALEPRQLLEAVRGERASDPALLHADPRERGVEVVAPVHVNRSSLYTSGEGVRPAAVLG